MSIKKCRLRRSMNVSRFLLGITSASFSLTIFDSTCAVSALLNAVMKCVQNLAHEGPSNCLFAESMT